MAENSANPAGSAAEAIFNEALGRPAGERAAYVAEACGADVHLRARLEALLRAHEAPEGFLPEEPGAGPKLDLSNATAEALPPDEKPGDTIGRYKLLERIGEGGFGTVYIAEQKEPVKRLVALKIIKLGMNTRQVVARFQTERQALALMDHPSIAKVFDAGASESGRPYFVMELVQGVKITDYCDQNQLSTRQRLELFTQVCRAVQHAHQKGIIHRDLKPSNILVAPRDGQPVPKIIDFGIAKATQAELTEQTVFTEFGHFIGTPAYMSPEQAELSRLDVDTRSDIYSLGVLLYELLTGTTPFETKELLSGGWEEMRRTIKHEEPPTPSVRLTQLQLVAADGTPDHSKIKNQKSKIPADLDWIVMKCLEKDRTRRYDTANGLATDIQRHLNNEPVLARPPSRLYEFQKSVRRHKAGFAATAAVILALSVGVVVSTWQALRAKRAERDQSRLRLEAEGAKRDATEKLRGSYLAEGRARRFSGEAGQRFESLAALSNAAAIRPSLELRNEAIATMALADIRFVPELEKRFKHKEEFVNTDAVLERYAVGNTNGTISIRRLSDDKELILLPPTGGGVAPPVIFSPNGKLLQAMYRDKVLRLWELESRKVRFELPFTDGACSFDRDCTVMAALRSNSFALYDLANQRLLKTIAPGARLSACRVFNPNGRLLLCTSDDTNALVLDTQTGNTLLTLAHPGAIYSLAWHPGSKYLATACDDNLIYIWDFPTGSRVRTLEGHKGTPVSLDFSHDGRLLASGGWDTRLRLWDFEAGRQLVSIIGGGLLAFGPDDSRVVGRGWDLNELGFYEIAPGHEERTIYERGRVPGAPGGNAFFSASGRLLVYDTTNGATIYDVQEHCEVGSIKGPVTVWGFDAADTSVLGLSDEKVRVFRWVVQPQAGGSARAGRDIELGPQIIGGNGSLSAGRNACVVVGGERAQVFRTDTFTEQARTEMQPGMRWSALSPDENLVATGAFHYNGVKVWDAHTGKLLKALPTSEESATAIFSPDGHWLVTASTEFQFWQVGTWSPGLRIAPSHTLMPAMAFSPDGNILASMVDGTKVRLYRAASGETLADLEAPNPWPVTCLSFSPDGTQLAVCEGHSALRVWDLRAIRRQLAKMRLDWNLPPYPPKPQSLQAK